MLMFLRSERPMMPAWPGRYQAEIHAVHVRADRLPAKIAAFVAHLLAVTDPAA